MIKNNGTESDAEDVFQDGIVVLYLKLKKEPDINIDLGAYLFGINRNIWLKNLRKSTPFVLEGMEKAAELVEEMSLYKKQISIRDSLNQLDQHCKEILIDFYFNRSSMAQISKRFGLSSEKVAKNKKYRCLQKLVSYVEKNKLIRTDFSNE